MLLRALEYFVTISGSIGLFVEISRVELFLLFSPLPFMSLLAYFVSSVCIYLSNENNNLENILFQMILLLREQLRHKLFQFHNPKRLSNHGLRYHRAEYRLKKEEKKKETGRNRVVTKT